MTPLTTTTSGAYNTGTGTWTDFSGSIVNSGGGYGAYNTPDSGTWSQFSGTIVQAQLQSAP